MEAKSGEYQDSTSTDDGTIDVISNQFSKLNDVAPCKKNVRIKCGEKTFRVHRTILCKSSPKFRQIAEGIDPNRVWQINLSNVPADMIRPILQYIYKPSENVFNKMHIDALFPLLSLCHSMEMDQAETAIFGDILQRSMSCSITAYLWDLACDYNNYHALTQIVHFIHDNIEKMVDKGFFRAIRWDQLHLLMGHCFCTGSHPVGNLCTAIVQWLNVDPEHRDSYTQSIARCLKWKQLSMNEIAMLMSKEPIFCRILKKAIKNGNWFPPPYVRQTLLLSDRTGTGLQCDPQLRKLTSHKSSEEEIMSNYLMAWRRNIPVSLLSTPLRLLNCGNPIVVALGITRSNCMAIQFFNPVRCDWSVPYETQMVYHGETESFSRKGLVYFIGGKYSNGSIMDQCYIFDVSRMQLTRFLDLRHPRADHGLAVFGQDMYLIGGINWMKQELSATLKMSLDSRFQIWRHLKPLRCKCASPGVVVDPDGIIFVIGGHTCNCESYDIANDVWMDMVSLPEPFGTLGIRAIYQDKQVYAFRSYRPTEVCVFQVSTNEMCIMRTAGNPPKDILKMILINEEFWALDKEGNFFIFNPEINFWRKSKVTKKCVVKIIQIETIQEEYLGLGGRLQITN